MMMWDGRGPGRTERLRDVEFLCKTYQGVNHDGFIECAHAGHLDGFQVENVDTVEITQKLESLKTSCLLFTETSARTRTMHPFPLSRLYFPPFLPLHPPQDSP